MAMEKSEILSIVKNDFEQAKEAKTDIDSKISTWLDEYEGELYGNESNGRSKIVIKDIKKAVEWFLPNAVSPFVSKNRIVRLEGQTAEDVDRASMHEKLINYQFVRSFDRFSFAEDMFRVGATEGTTVIQCGWELDESVTTEKLENISEMQLQQVVQQYEIEDLEENKDGTYNLTAINRVVKKNNPTAKIVRNDKCYPDPLASCIEDASFFIFEEDTSISDLRQAEEDGLYENIDEIISSFKDKSESSLHYTREDKLSNYGRDEDYASKAEASKEVTIYHYWGYLDLNEDGIVEPVVVTWCNNVILRAEENPYPDKEIPFVSIPFIKIPFAFWGNPLAELLSDNQKIRSSIMRGIIDNLAQSNNGFKFFKKGSIDVVNKQKLLANTGGVIEVNGDQSDMWDGSHNQIPSSVFAVYEMMKQESESLAGYAQGIDPKLLSSTATGVATQSAMGDKRMEIIIRAYAEGLKKVFRKWLSYNKKFLNDKEVVRISGKFIEFTKDDIDGSFDIEIQVGTDGVDSSKANQITMLMQQIGGLSGTVDPTVLNKLLAKLADIWGFPDIAMELEQAKAPQKSPEQIAMEQRIMELENQLKESEVELNKAKSTKTLAEANKTTVEAKQEAYGLNNK